jgi:cobalt-zinc-cadmium efflux system protein
MHGSPDENVRVLQKVLLLTGFFFLVEIAAGFITGSLALLSDSGHMLSDTLSLGVSLYAAYMAQKAPTAQKSYGYIRTEVLAGLFNGVSLWLIVGLLFFEAAHRLFLPHRVNGSGVIVVGAAGLIVNIIAARMLHRHEGLNMKSAYYHVLTDALGSVAALLSGILISITGWTVFDPALSIVIGLLVLYSTWSLIRDSINILMESVPGHLDPSEIRSSLLGCTGVENVHDLHIWSIGSNSHALSAHIVVPSQHNPFEVRNRVERILQGKFDLSHTTLQMEIQEDCSKHHD